MTAAPDRSYVCPVLIGRSAQLEALDRATQQTKAFRLSTVLISGEAGIGKSRLAGEAIVRATAEGFGVLRGDCFESGRALPFSAVLDLLRSYLAGQEEDVIEHDLGPAATEIVKLVPELSSVLPGLTASAPLGAEEEKHRLFYALLQFLSRAAERQPQVILFEDLHWSDATTLEFLAFLLRRSTGSREGIPLLLLLTYRNDEVQPDLAALLAEADRRRAAAELRLDRLSMLESDVMVRATLDLRHPLRRDYIEALHSLTGGNPFFIEELLKASAGAEADAGPDVAFESGAVPRTVQEAVRRRAAELSGPARDLLDVAAVCGVRFELALLQELTGEDRAALLLRLRELVAAQLILEESATRFSFRHALTRQAIYTRLLAAERRDLHRRVGEALLRLSEGAPAREDSYAGDLAYHFYEGEVWDEALRHCEQAADLAQRLSTPAAVVQHLSHAIEAAAKLSLPPAAHRLRILANAYEVLGDFDRARASMEAALETARRDSDQREEWQALIGLGVIWSPRDYARTGEYWQAALDLARAIGDEAMLAHSLNRAGNWSLNVERPVEAIRHHEEALRRFEQAGDTGGVAETLDLLGMTWYLGGDMHKSRAYYELALPLFEQIENSSGYASSLSTLAVCLSVYHTDTLPPSITVAQGVEWLERARGIVTGLTWRSGEAYVLLNFGLILGPAGEYGRALESTLGSLAIAEDIGHLAWTSAALWTLGSIQFDLLDFAAAHASLERAYATAQQTGSLHWRRCAAASFARCHLALGRPDLAQAVLDETLQLDGSPRTLGERGVQAARVELALTRGDADTALRLLDGLLGAESLAGAAPPRLGKLQADALLLGGDRTGAEAAYLEAADAAGRQGQRGILWRIHAGLSRLYRETGRRSDSAEHRHLAEELIGSLAASISGAPQREAFLRDAMAQLPPRLTPRQEAKLAAGGLTQREREVAALIARGASNAEIAAGLVVSERTVETHVTNILAKLSFTSRAQIAAWAVANGLVAGV